MCYQLSNPYESSRRTHDLQKYLVLIDGFGIEISICFQPLRLIGNREDMVYHSL